MKTRHLVVCFALALLTFTQTWAAQGISLIGVATIPGDARDLSGLTGPVTGAAGTIPHDQLGSFGSGIAYTGHDDVYVAVNDRGWSDGLTVPSYIDRFQFFHLKIDAVNHTVTPTLLDTRFFKDQFGRTFVGDAGAFTPPPLRFDPEGVRIGVNGNFYVSDEYGPYIYEFDRQGNLVRSIAVPPKFLIANPNATGALELPPGNTSGRQANRGMEGLAISPDGRFLYGLMQNALIQDGALNASNSRRGINNRLLQIDLMTGATMEFVYQLTDRSYGANELLAINDHEFLAIERDGSAPAASPRFKKIYKITITPSTTDVSNHLLPQTGTTYPLPDVGTFTPVVKSEFLDFFDPQFGLAPDSIPEKPEGLGFGPDLPDGRHTLIVTSDNDLMTGIPTYFWVFAIDPSALPGYQAQTLPGPFFPPGQVQKITGGK